ncbi:MAG: hypothetical protein ACOYB7_03035 [Mycobacterium sp.]
MRQPQLHLLTVHLRTTLQLRPSRGVRQPRLHVFALQLRIRLLLRLLSAHADIGTSRDS